MLQRWNKKDGYCQRQQNVRQRQKSRGLKICSRSILPVRQINIWHAPIRVNFGLYERQEIIITKGGYFPTHLHKCCQNIRSYIFSLLVYSPCIRVSLCRPNNVEFSRHAEKSISNELSTAICTFWPPLVTPLGQSR